MGDLEKLGRKAGKLGQVIIDIGRGKHTPKRIVGRNLAKAPSMQRALRNSKEFQDLVDQKLVRMALPSAIDCSCGGHAWIAAACCAFGIVLSTGAGAAVISVKTTADDAIPNGDCSLREAIQAATIDAAVDACAAGSGADTVSVPAGTFALATTLALGPNVTIQGAGRDVTVLDGGDAVQVFGKRSTNPVIAWSDLGVAPAGARDRGCAGAAPRSRGARWRAGAR